VSLTVNDGETVGIVGESGCGKSSFGLSIMQLLPRNAKIIGGQIRLKGSDLLDLSEAEMRRIRGSDVSIVFQTAFSSLNPVMRVGDQVAETLTAHSDTSKTVAMNRVKELFDMLGLPPTRIKNFPHEFSGGMAQRVLLAVALIGNPELIIADEPTSALDVIVQDQVLQEIKEIQKKLGFSLIIISHDISVISENCDKIAVMYAGEIVEFGDKFNVLKNPLHPYTKALMSSIPDITGPRKRLAPVEGIPPSLLHPPEGCRFMPRCPYAQELCKTKPKVVELEDGRYYRCHFTEWNEVKK
jgi:peptide/nickel transport system ATP-binding protein